MKAPSARFVSEVALLTALLFISGIFKIPSFYPGAEFQMSSPLSVAICFVYGMKKYLLVGFLASFIGLITGAQNISHVVIACVFRVVVLIVLFGGGKSRAALLLAGPLGSITSRFCLALIIDSSAYPLILAAAPGMIYTMIFVHPLIKVLWRVQKNR